MKATPAQIEAYNTFTDSTLGAGLPLVSLATWLQAETNKEIQSLIAAGALFVVNHSGGKDSQAMYIKLMQMVPAEQLVLVHAELPGVEWAGTLEHIQATAKHPLHVVQATKTFFEMVDARGMFPSPKYRQCTSDLKRGPIEKAIRQMLKGRENKIVVSCMGLRAGESCNRANKEALVLDAKNSKAGRTWYNYLPIHELTEEEVFSTIAGAGEKAHWAYSVGMSRLSCAFCIMSSKEDLSIAAKYNPEMLAAVDRLERKHQHTLLMPAKGQPAKFLVDVIAEYNAKQAPAEVEAVEEVEEVLVEVVAVKGQVTVAKPVAMATLYFDGKKVGSVPVSDFLKVNGIVPKSKPDTIHLKPEARTPD